MKVNIKEFLPRFAFYTQNGELHVFSDVKKSQAEPKDERWIHWPDFYHLPFEFLTYQNHYTFKISEMSSGLSEVPLSFDFKPPVKKQFEETFAHLQTLFQEKALDKAVPVVWSESVKIPSQEEVSQLVQALLSLPFHFHCYGVLTEKVCILGASPEYLVQIVPDEPQTQKLLCVAVAGTRLSEKLDATEFLNAAKDREEHQFVIEDIRKKLKKIGIVQQGETRIQNFGLISHLVTEFEVPLGMAQLNLKQIYLLIKTMHPTSALGLYSKTMFWKEAEIFPGQQGRHRKFGAPLTFSTKNGIKSVVAIRNLIWDQHKTYLSVGCGVTAKSQLDKEWDELYNKTRAVMRLFGIQS